MDKVSVLKLTLHGQLVGYLAGFQSGRNVLSFAPEYKNNPGRPTFSLVTHPNFPKSEELMSQTWAKKQKLHPVLSNLLPEGSPRDLLSQELKIHIDNEFRMFSHLGRDLPGALVATPMDPQDVPTSIMNTHGPAQAIKFGEMDQTPKFSLAGVQMKFSMKAMGSRYNFSENGELGDWIIKTPSTQHKHVPLNEFTAMTLAELAGVDIPEIKLIERTRLDNLPSINLPDEELAFAIKRFDRDGNTRIHMEDFAQVLVKDPRNKYDSANYEQIGRVLYEFSGDGLADAQQFARRLLVNILLANGDAHLKNWSLYYPDQITPRLSPAYDIVTTNVYFDDETKYALNLGKTKEWYSVTEKHFQAWANNSGIPWRAIKPHIDDTMDKARSLWPEALKTLPMDAKHNEKLRAHWGRLQNDFKI
ncbi:MAG: phosphatidylinositol kinase [Robiginitomaculum sp.]|nr:MAG: phosphatidylinositol kinase [Robiginitomaculum sp.]